MALSTEEVLVQSKAAMQQWGPTWEKHSKINGEIYKKQETSHKDILFEEIGSSLLCLGFGPSFFKNLELIKKYKDKVTIACVDKCMGVLLDNGIKPKYVFLADAGISYDKWLKPWINQTEDMFLMTNVTANVDWTMKWQGKIYFYVNKDNIKSEEIYGPMSGCTEQIPASSNVSNSVVVFAAQILGADELLLCGFDYGWANDENYYATVAEDDPETGKRYWMKHIQTINYKGDMINTSQNLMFSSRWMQDFNANVIPFTRSKLFNCCGGGILNVEHQDLEKKLKDAAFRKITDKEKEMVAQKRMDVTVISSADGVTKLEEVMNNNNVINVGVNHLSDESIKFLEAH